MFHPHLFVVKHVLQEVVLLQVLSVTSLRRLHQAGLCVLCDFTTTTPIHPSNPIVACNCSRSLLKNIVE